MIAGGDQPMRKLVVALAIALTAGLGAAGSVSMYLSITSVVTPTHVEWLARTYTATKTLPKSQQSAGTFIFASPRHLGFGAMDRDKQWGANSVEPVSY
jgi:hypothetical protein